MVVSDPLSSSSNFPISNLSLLSQTQHLMSILSVYSGLGRNSFSLSFSWSKTTTSASRFSLSFREQWCRSFQNWLFTQSHFSISAVTPAACFNFRWLQPGIPPSSLFLWLLIRFIAQQCHSKASMKTLSLSAASRPPYLLFLKGMVWLGAVKLLQVPWSSIKQAGSTQFWTCTLWANASTPEEMMKSVLRQVCLQLIQD